MGGMQDLTDLPTKALSKPWQLGVFRAKGVPSYRFKTAIWVVLREFSTTKKRKPPNINDLAVCVAALPPLPAFCRCKGVAIVHSRYAPDG